MSDVTVKVGELTDFMVALLSAIGDDAYAGVRSKIKKDAENEVLYTVEIEGARLAGSIGAVGCWRMLKSNSISPLLLNDSVFVYVNHPDGHYVQTLPLSRNFRLLKDLGYAQE